MKQTSLLIWLIQLVLLVILTSPIHLPQCQVGFFYKTLPLVADETFIIDLDSQFGGYNLEYTTIADESISKYITLGSKIQLQKQQFPDVPMTGLKSYHLQKIGNSWGQRFITLSQKRDKTFVHYGILSDNSTVPVINNFIQVQNNTNTSCYDSVMFPVQNLIIVDCAIKRSSPNSKGQMYDNIFYYFYISNGTKATTIRTEMFIAFQKIQRRRLDIYSDLMSSHTFLLRSYLSDGMNDKNKDNTYMQVFMIENPLDPWVVGIIDRSFLQTPRLRIMDVKIYLGEIYILDYLKGLHRVYISTSQDLTYQGVYEAKGFTRFGLFSPNLDNHLELAIANDHSVHEIDWTYIDEPRLLNKYSLMPDSKISQIFINERFVFIQSSSIDNDFTYNYTWILNRGDRTFSRAFKVIKHNTSNTMIDLNQELTMLMIIEDERIANYKLDQANLIFKPDSSEDLLDVISNFTINAVSYDPNSPQLNATCSLSVNFTVLYEYNRTMWPIGSAPPSFYNANYPGKVKIELYEYIIGPNVTYRIRQTEKGQIKKSKVFQQQQLNVTWQKSPPFQNITFLQTETIHKETKDELVIYMQDKSNLTYISFCNPDHHQTGVYCNEAEVKDVGGQVNNWATTIFDSMFTHQTHHILAYTTEKFYNTIFISDIAKKKQVTQLNLGKGFPGNISSLTVTGKYLYTVLRHIKRVNVYPLDLCLEDECTSICSINHLNMYKLGLKYFSPKTVHSSPHHPDILFIKTSDTIIVVDLSKQCVPKLLTVVRPVQSVLVDFAFEVNSDYMVVTIAPNIVQEYDLSRLYLKQVRMTKRYPLYGYKLPKDHEFDLSDYGNCVYLSTLSEGGDYNIFVYRSGYPAVGSLYIQIDLFAYQNILVDASGYIVDYLTVVAGKQLRIFRVYQYPEAQIVNPKTDYKFYLEYFNTIDSGSLELVEVKIINLPTYIHVNPYLNDIMNTKDLLYSGYNKLSQINDTDWYEGNVLYISPSCRDCGTKIKISNHIEGEGIINVAPGLTDYVYSVRGGSAQMTGGLVSFKHNGTIAKIVIFPQNDKKECIKVQTGFRDRFEISGCVSQDAIFLFITSFVGNTAFTMQPFQTEAQNLFKIQATQQIIMLVDTQINPYKKKTRGGIFLYEISSDDQNSQALTQLQYFDGQDFGMRQLGPIYINNAELTYNAVTSTYRLYISQMTKGLFMVQFSHKPGHADIIIKQIVFIDLKKMLNDLKETLPYDASFQAISLISSTMDSFKRVTQNLLITTGRYNTIHLSVTYNTSSVILSKKIVRFYLRYSYYQITNHISHTNNFFLIKHSLPDQFDEGNQTRQLYTVYSTHDVQRPDIQKRGMIGAYPLSDNKAHSFDFNLTYNSNDMHSQPRIGIAIVENLQSNIQRASLHRNIGLFTTQLLDTQIIYIDLKNDFNTEKIRILINGIAPFPEWKLITIILFSIIGGLLLIGGSVLGFKKWKDSQPTMGEERDTLLTQSTYN